MNTYAEDATTAGGLPSFPHRTADDWGGGVVVHTGASWEAIRAYVADVTGRPLAHCHVAAHEVLALATGTLAAHWGIDAHYDGRGIDDPAGTLWVAPGVGPDAVVAALFDALGSAVTRLVAAHRRPATAQLHAARLAAVCHAARDDWH